MEVYPQIPLVVTNVEDTDPDPNLIRVQQICGCGCGSGSVSKQGPGFGSYLGQTSGTQI